MFLNSMYIIEVDSFKWNLNFMMFRPPKSHLFEITMAGTDKFCQKKYHV